MTGPPGFMRPFGLKRKWSNLLRDANRLLFPTLSCSSSPEHLLSFLLSWFL